MANMAEKALREGAALLDPFLQAHGFLFSIRDTGSSSGGFYAAGEYRRDARRLELHFRHALGMVSYHFGERSVSHQDYMRSVLGKPHASHYPGFSKDPIDAFRDLLLDLQQHGMEFLEASDEPLEKRFNIARALPALEVGPPH
jgi:hypothetical protein